MFLANILLINTDPNIKVSLGDNKVTFFLLVNIACVNASEIAFC
jgi:hypothetical protein